MLREFRVPRQRVYLKIKKNKKIEKKVHRRFAGSFDARLSSSELTREAFFNNTHAQRIFARSGPVMESFHGDEYRINVQARREKKLPG